MRSALSYGLAAGASTTDRVAVINYSARALTLRVYGADAAGSGSTFTLAAADAVPTGVGAWLSFEGKRSVTVTVPAGRATSGGAQVPGRAVVPVLVAVGVQAPPGEYAGGVVVALDTAKRFPSGAGLTLEQRVALRVYVDVNGLSQPRPSVSALPVRPVADTHSSSRAASVWAGGALLFILLCAVAWGRRLVLARRKNS